MRQPESGRVPFWPRGGAPRSQPGATPSPEPSAPAAASANFGFSRLGRGGRGQRARRGRGPEPEGPESSTALTYRNFPRRPRKRRRGGAGAEIAGLRGRRSSPRPCPKPDPLHRSVRYGEPAIPLWSSPAASPASCQVVCNLFETDIPRGAGGGLRQPRVSRGRARGCAPPPGRLQKLGQ